MKPLLEHLPREKNESFVVKYFDYKYYPTPWHYHPEYELVLVTNSTGKRFIGDDVSNFSPGDLVFIGPNLPHTYRNDDHYYQLKSKGRAQSIVVHFLEDALGEGFLSLPEALPLKNLFTKSVRGLKIKGKTSQLIAEKMHRLLTLKGLARWLQLVDILHVLSTTKDYQYISNAPVLGQNEKETDRMSKVLEYVIQNFSGNIRVKDVANLVNMAENSFSRYFAQRTRKTFTSFVNEIRLNHASKLLMEGRISIAEICFECGFNNLSNFNRQFRNTYGVNPLGYRKEQLSKSL